MKITIQFEKLESLEFQNYEGLICLDKINNIEIERYNISELIEFIGKDLIIEAIGKDRFLEHFNIEEAE